MKDKQMNLLTKFLVLALCASFILCQEEGGGTDEPVGGHDQPAPDPASQAPGNSNQKAGEGDAGKDGKKEGEQGFTQGFNQGVKPYSYGYNTGIKPYSYNFYQPYGGKPQVVEQGGPDADKTADAGKKAPSAQPSPPPLPAIEFPADFSAFGLNPADLTIPPPPPPPPQSQGRGQLSGQQRTPATPFNFPPPQQTNRPAEPGAAGQTPPPFNYADYGIPTDIGTATGSAGGSPFGLLDGGIQQQQRPQSRMMEGDDFGIFGGNGNNNANNGLVIPVLEDGNNQQSNQQNNLAIPLFGGGGGQSPGNDFNFANNDMSNDFNVAASDFEPFNFQNFVPAEFAQTVGPAGVAGSKGPSRGVASGSGAQKAALVAQNNLANHRPEAPKQQPSSAVEYVREEKKNTSHKPSVQQRKQMYKTSLVPEVVKRSARSLNEQPHEKPLKDDPNSAWNILNMDPQYTNPNQGVYSYYPAYRMPS